MIAAGYTGDKGKGGFYRLGENDAEEAIDLETGKPARATRNSRRWPKMLLPVLPVAVSRSMT